MKYLVAHEGSWIFNQEKTYWRCLDADSPQEAAAYLVAQLLSYRMVQDPTDTVRLPEAEVLGVDIDPLSFVNPNGDVGSYLVKLEGQAGSEAVAVLVNVNMTLCGRLTPRHQPSRR